MLISEIMRMVPHLDGFGRPALLHTSRVGHNTVCALLIASMDHIHLRSILRSIHGPDLSEGRTPLVQIRPLSSNKHGSLQYARQGLTQRVGWLRADSPRR